MNAENVIDGNTRAHSQDGYTSWHMVASAHETSIRALTAQINELQGIGAKPQLGCHFREVSLGDLTVNIEFEFEGGEPQTHDHPGCEASVTILQVFLNGCWVDPADFVSPAVIERWEQEILEVQADDSDGSEDYDCDNYLADIAADRYERDLDRTASQ
jgi:hypothetical protein